MWVMLILSKTNENVAYVEIMGPWLANGAVHKYFVTWLSLKSGKIERELFIYVRCVSI